MRFELIRYNKKSESVTELEKTLSDLIGLTSSIECMMISENVYQNDVNIELTISDSARGQKIKVFDIEAQGAVLDNIKHAVSQCGSTRVVKAIKLLPLSGGRALGVVITESAAEVKTDDGTGTKRTRKETKRKSNKETDARSDSGAEGGTVS